MASAGTTTAPAGRHENRLRKTGRCYTTACARPAMRRLLSGLASGMIAEQGFLVAVALYAHSQGGATMVGAIALVQMVAAAMAAPLFGRGAERRSCRAVLRGAAGGEAALMLLTGAAAAGRAAVPIVLFLATAGAVAAGASRPVRFALLPWLATSPEELEAANVASSTSEGVSYFAGPALAGLSVAAGGPAAAMVVAAGMAGAAAVAAHRLPVIPAATAACAGGRLVDGFIVLFRHASTVTALSVLQTFVRGLLNVLVVVVALELFRTGESGVALLQALLGVGGVVGSLVVAAAARGNGHAPRLALALVCWGAPLSFIGLIPHPAVAGAALIAIGVANVAVDVNAVTLLQRVLPPDSAARSFASLECLFLCAVGAGSMAGGILSGLVGPRAALVVAGVLLPLAVAGRLGSLLALGRSLEAGQERTASVRQVPSLGALPLAAVDLLTAVGQEVAVAPGTSIVRQGATDDDVYVVVRGQACVLKGDVEVGRAGPGQVIGELAALYGQPRTATVVAGDDLVVLRITGPAYLAALASSRQAEELAHQVAASYGGVRFGAGGLGRLG